MSFQEHAQTTMISLSGRSLIGEHSAKASGAAFHAVNPATGTKLEPAFYTANLEEIDEACNLAADAFRGLSSFSGRDRAGLLRRIAENLHAEGAAIVERANLETGLPVARLQGELKRTTGQLNLFADLIAEGSWVNARIDEPDRERKPVPRPD